MRKGTKWALVMMTALMMLTVPYVPSRADLRIVLDTEGERSEILFKGTRVLVPTGDAGRMFVDCTTESVTIVDQNQYWQGSMAELKAALNEYVERLLKPTDDAPAFPSFLGGLFGSPAKSGPVEVRVAPQGSTLVAGYEAAHYKIETRQGSGWRTYEDLWISNALLQEIKAEAGGCVKLIVELSQLITSLIPIGMDEVHAVLTDSAYQALFDAGYPVRTTSTFELFGISLDLTSEVIQVNRNPIPEDQFSVPAGFRRVDHPSALFGID